MSFIDNSQYKVLIIGAGNIGAFFDTPLSENILTHAHAFCKHKGFSLAGFIDIDPKKAQQAVTIWGGNHYSSIKEAFDSDRIDVCVISSPDESHYNLLKEVLSFPVKLVFLEKPVTKTLYEANNIKALIMKKNIPVAVNYSRRYVPEFQNIKKEIEAGLFGNYISGTCYTGKGIIHSTSHFIDLLAFWNLQVEKTYVLDSLNDFYDDDKSVSAVLIFQTGKSICIQYIDCRLYQIGELDLLFEKKRIRVIEGGRKIEKYELQQNRVFSGYKNMMKTSEINTDILNSNFHAADNIYKHLLKHEKLLCSFEDGYKALKICANILKKA